MSMSKPEIEQREDGWWVTIGLCDINDIGPCDTRKEAVEFGRGLCRYLRYRDEPGFITVEDL